MNVASCAYYVSENYVMLNACFASENQKIWQRKRGVMKLVLNKNKYAYVHISI